MTWVDVGVQTGRKPVSDSVSVVPASDYQDPALDVLDAIQNNTLALSAAKGVLSDLRVTPTGTVIVAGNLTVTGQTNMGGLALNNVVPNWQNQTAIQSFVNNIVRS